VVSAHVFETLLIGYLVLLAGNLFDGITCWLNVLPGGNARSNREGCRESSRYAVGFLFLKLAGHRLKQHSRFFVSATQGLTPQHYGVTGRCIRIIKRSDGLRQVDVFSSGD